MCVPQGHFKKGHGFQSLQVDKQANTASRQYLPHVYAVMNTNYWIGVLKYNISDGDCWEEMLKLERARRK